MKFELDKYHRNTPINSLLNDLKRVAKELNKNTVTINEYNERGEYHSTTLTRRLKCGWLDILKKAGLEKTRNLNIPERELFENLEVVWAKLGRQPRYSEIAKPLSKYSAGTYEKRFGTFRKALERFVNFINKTELPIVRSKGGVYKKSHKTKRSINWRLRFIVMRRDSFKCKMCGKSPANDIATILHVDHVRPWNKGGETVLENLQTLCSKCNIGKSDLTIKKV